jgi:anti-sigma factor RsiW
MKLKSQHIPFEKLADLVENRLTPEESDATRSHLNACADCASQLTKLDQLVNVMRADTAEDAPSDLVSRTIRLFRPRATEAKPSVIERVMAVLSFDSRQLSPAFGVRSGQSVARQLLFSVGEHDLDLRVAPDDGAWVVSGQVLGECESGQVELRGDSITERAALNDLCEFTLPRVPSGKYALVINFSNTEIEVPEFELKA